MATITWVFVLLSVSLVSRSVGAASLEHLGYQPQAPMPYEFGYGVNFPYTGDAKEHKEITSESGRTEGEYRWLQPNGLFRVVRYYIEGPSGFIAEVTEEEGPEVSNYVSSKLTGKDIDGGFGSKQSQGGLFQGDRESESLGLQRFHSGSQEFQSAAGFIGSQNAQLGFKSSQASLGSQRYQAPQGQQAFQGPQISQGYQASQGRQALPGQQAFQGPKASQGYQSSQGQQAFQGHTISQGNQFSQGQEAPQGYQTPQVHAVSQGYQSSQRDQTFRGHQTSQGHQLSQGYQSPQGPQTSQGYQASQGRQAFQGQSISKGYQTSQGRQGFQGQKISQGYQSPTKHQSIQGHQAVQGHQASQGQTLSQGYQAPQRPQPSQGYQAPQRPQPSQGYQAPQRPQASQGYQAPQKPQASQGYQAPQKPQASQGYQLPQKHQNIQVYQLPRGIQVSQGSQGKNTVPQQLNLKNLGLLNQNAIFLNANSVQRQNGYASTSNTKTQSSMYDTQPVYQKNDVTSTSSKAGLNQQNTFQGNLGTKPSFGLKLLSSKTAGSAKALGRNALAQTILQGLAKSQQGRSSYSNLRSTHGQAQPNLAQTNLPLAGYGAPQKLANLQAGLNNNVRIGSVRIIDSKPLVSPQIPNPQNHLLQSQQNQQQSYQNQASLSNLSGGGSLGLNLNNLGRGTQSSQNHLASSISGTNTYSPNNEAAYSSEETDNNFVPSNSYLPPPPAGNAGILKIEGEDTSPESYDLPNF